MMNILVDSCCDLTPDWLKKTQAKVAPLTITIDDTHYVDDGTVDIPAYLSAMKESRHPVRSACPSDRKSTRLNSSHSTSSRMPSSA